MTSGPARQLHLWAFLQGIGFYPFGWRHRGAQPRSVFDLSYYSRVAKRIEHARFDAIVFGDQLQARGDHGRTPRHLPMPTLDPLALLGAMGSVTERVGLVATVSTTYNDPTTVADKFATLDHLTRGRAGWNIVTTAHPAAAWNFSQQALPEKALRYQRADEFVGVVKSLWDSGQPPGSASNPTVEHAGRWLTLRGALATPRLPQGRPVLVQAGQSGDGRDFAAKTAEAVFCPAKTLADGRAYRDDIRARMAPFGRAPDDVKIMPGMSFILAPTEAEAIAKEEELLELASEALCIEYLGESIGYDLMAHPAHGPIPLAEILADCEMPPADIARMLEPVVRAGISLSEFSKAYVRTPRGHHVFKGTPEQLADTMGQWLDAGACDGFTLQPAYMPGELDLFIDEVVPILQRRGLLRREYEGTTLRSHLGLPAL
jgi:FMN-dependent oxidoreductase (nitrilotriacetate monooxygenase family)